jgi:hypothetical protein
VFLLFLSLSLSCIFLLLIVNSGVEAGKKAAGEVLALQKRVLAVLNEARYNVKSLVVLEQYVNCSSNEKACLKTKGFGAGCCLCQNTSF